MFTRTRNRFAFGPFSISLGEPSNAKSRIMSLFKKLLSSFDLPPSPPTDTEASRRRLARGTVSERSHGNIHLQMGEYYTGNDLDKEVAEVKSFDFRSSSISKNK